jgi:hypothetical protein
MIGKMKSMTCNNSISNIKEKYSKKRLTNISNRIRSLEKDINNLKNKETLYDKKSIDNNISLIFDKNSNTMITNEPKLKPKSKYNISHKSFVKNYLFYNDNKSNIKYNTNNNSFSKKKHKNKIKEYSKSQIYKKINNYNNLIHEKKHSLLNLKSHFHKRSNTKDSYKDFSKISSSKNFEPNKKLYKIDYIKEQNNLYDIRIQPNFHEKNKTHHFMSVDKINTNIINNENNVIVNDLKDDIHINDNISDMGKLEYEFEIRHLKKKRNLLKQTNKEIIEKLNEIKNKNNYLESNIVEEQKNNQNLMNNLVLLNKKFIIHNNQNGLESIESSSNGSTTNEFSLKNIILNIMDIKFDYENNILLNNFIEGINELLNMPFLNNNNYNDNILKKLKDLINCENDLEISNNKYKKLFKENSKYLIYFKNLLSNLNLYSYEELYKFVQDMFVKNIKENERMKQIKKALINDRNPDNQKVLKEKENLKRKIGNKYSHSVNQTIFNNNENNYYKLKKSYIDIINNPRIEQKKIDNYIYSKKKDINYNINFPQNILNKTEKNINYNSSTKSSSNINLLNINRHSIDDSNLKNNYHLFLCENDKKYITGKNSNKKYKIYLENNKNNENINTFMKPNYYNGINKYYNGYINQTNFIKNEDDIKYLNDEEEEKMGTNFNKKPLDQTKNHSAFNIIFNK